MNTKKSISIIGGGPASLMLACSLDPNKYDVAIYEKKAALARKFLVAGKGGFNLTHSENLIDFTNRYTPNEFVYPFLNYFSNTDFRNWLASIGIETYVGTSKRVFPKKGIKPIEVLKAIENKLAVNNVSINCNFLWTGWKEDLLQFSNNNKTVFIKSDITVFALGGSSWKITGSDGNWTDYFKNRGVKSNPFLPSNCAFKINWTASLLKSNSGQALKNCAFTCGSISKLGEAVLTDFGIEGSGVYALSTQIRDELANHNFATLKIDFKPQLAVEEVKRIIDNRGRLSVMNILEKKLNLSKTQIRLLKEIPAKEEYQHSEKLCNFIKNFPITIVDCAPIDEAISTVGGISLEEINSSLELNILPNNYCIGEMLDWDAPTGGYLLQACFSMGKFLADHLNR